VRVGGNALAAGFLAEVVHLVGGQAAEHEGAGVDARHRMALEEDQVTAGRVIDTAPEMREADVVERGGRGEGGDVAADVGVLVGAHDHDHGIPADVGVDLDFHVRIARILGLLIGRNGVDVFGVGGVRNVDTVLARLTNQFFDQEMGPVSPFLGDDAFQGIDPFAGFLRVGIGSGCSVGQRQGAGIIFGHVTSCWSCFIRVRRARPRAGLWDRLNPLNR
jgi:hypothetical protein